MPDEAVGRSSTGHRGGRPRRDSAAETHPPPKREFEVWTAGEGWTVLNDVPETDIVGPDPQGVYRGDNHLWLFSAPNGEVFHAGPSAAMHWITTTGNGSIADAGNRGNDPYAINGSEVRWEIFAAATRFPRAFSGSGFPAALQS